MKYDHEYSILWIEKFEEKVSIRGGCNVMEEVVPEFRCDHSETIDSNLENLVEFLSNAPKFANFVKRKADEVGEEKQAKKVKLTDANGVEYFGEVNNDGQPHGYGKMMLPEQPYEGQWEDGKRHGQGTMICDNGHYYGQWKDDTLHCHGRYFWKSCRCYEGHWENGKNMARTSRLINLTPSTTASGRMTRNMARAS